MTQCKSTFPLTKGGAVFCVKREGHDGDHRGVGKQWRVMEVGDGFEVGMVESVKTNCLLFRFTRVTAAAPPDRCPRCGTKQEMP